jgi:hypothetical protein
MTEYTGSELRLCAYCGEETIDWTEDEPVPQCLFAKPRDQLISVSACKQCNNNEKSLDDSYLRDLLALHAAILEHPDGEFIRSRFLRAAMRDKSLVARIAMRHGELSVSPDSPIQFRVSFNRDRVVRVFKWIAQGLYYHEHDGAWLNKQYNFRCELISETRAEQMRKFIRDLGIKVDWKIGSRDQFQYFHIWFEDRNITFWQMVFYGTLVIAVSSVPPGIKSLQEYDRALSGLSF